MKITKVHKMIFCVLIFNLFFLASYTCFADDSGYKVLQAQTDVPEYKEWIINFSDLPDLTTLNADNITVTDSSNNSVPITVNFDSHCPKCATVRPVGTYKNGEKYSLNVSGNVKSKYSNSLKMASKMDFTIRNSSAKDTADIEVETAAIPLFKKITINSTTVPEVSKIRIDSTEGKFYSSQKPIVICTTKDYVNVYFYTDGESLWGQGKLYVKTAGKHVFCDIK